eukprot:2404736-Prorocentrum_lima.AAC.1
MSGFACTPWTRGVQANRAGAARGCDWSVCTEPKSCGGGGPRDAALDAVENWCWQWCCKADGRD